MDPSFDAAALPVAAIPWCGPLAVAARNLASTAVRGHKGHAVQTIINVHIGGGILLLLLLSAEVSVSDAKFELDCGLVVATRVAVTLVVHTLLAQRQAMLLQTNANDPAAPGRCCCCYSLWWSSLLLPA
jgi:hypothetical protein